MCVRVCVVDILKPIYLQICVRLSCVCQLLNKFNGERVLRYIVTGFIAHMVWNYKYNDECQYHWQSTFVDRRRRRSISLFLSICLTFSWQLDIVQLHRFNDKLYATLGERGYNVGRVSLLERVYSFYDSLISVAKLSHESATAPRITVQRTGRFYSFTASLARAHTHTFCHEHHTWSSYQIPRVQSHILRTLRVQNRCLQCRLKIIKTPPFKIFSHNCILYNEMKTLSMSVGE